VSQLSDYSVQFVVIGCYTQGAGGDGVGLTVTQRDPTTGALRPIGEATPTPSPSFVVSHPTLPVLYAVNELDEGALSAFAMAADGTLTALGTWPTGGALPCNVTVDTGRHVLVANYGRGSVALFAVDRSGRPNGRADLAEHSGSGKHPVRQEAPHAHQVVAMADGVYAVDLGIDSVVRYQVDHAKGRLVEAGLAAVVSPGTGPRHLALAPNGTVYLVGELAGTVVALRPGPGPWEELGSVPTTTSEPESAMPSEIATSGDGRWLYVGNRTPATISVFALGSADEMPVMVGEVPSGGAWPRHFALTDGYLYVANERSHTVAVFRVDAATGMPVPTGDVLATPSPTCVLPTAVVSSNPTRS
jgi:6-phosphogluconolactonase